MFHNRPFNVGLTDTICPTLANECNKAPGQTLIQPKAFGICSYDSNSMKSDNPHSGIYEADTTRTLDLNGGNPTCNQGGVCVVERMAFAQNQRDEVRDLNDISGSLASEPGMKQQTFIAEEHTEEDDNCEYVVRRLTERECERLQSYMDDWTVIPPINEEELPFWRTVWDKWCDICGAKKKSDNQILKWMKSPVSSSARYKALGNSIALPYWHWMLGRMAEYLPEDATLGSLFDGIGGFPRCWEMIHGKGKTLWASEIEPFPIAVTRYRFKEEQP